MNEAIWEAAVWFLWALALGCFVVAEFEGKNITLKNKLNNLKCWMKRFTWKHFRDSLEYPLSIFLLVCILLILLSLLLLYYFEIFSLQNPTNRIIIVILGFMVIAWRYVERYVTIGPIYFLFAIIHLSLTPLKLAIYIQVKYGLETPPLFSVTGVLCTAVSAIFTVLYLIHLI